MENSIPEQSDAPAPRKTSLLVGLVWWVTLMMAVIALPLAGTMIALAVTDSAFTQMVVFMITCWGCTWLGMWLMHRSKKHHHS